MLSEKLLPTTVVGSYPQPDWLVDRDVLTRGTVPRVLQQGFWRVPSKSLPEALDDASTVAIRDMERAGIDVITDGEVRRQSYSSAFATALSGVDPERPGIVPGRRAGTTVEVPRVVGPIARDRPVLLEDARFLRAATDRAVKVTVPGPFTLSQQCVDEHYGDPRALALAFAEAVNAEVRDLFAAGVDVVQLDEPWLQARADAAREFGVEAIDRALDGAAGVTALHLCFGYAAKVPGAKPNAYDFLGELDGCGVQQVSVEAAQPNLDLHSLQLLPSKIVVLGVLDLGSPEVETPETVAARIRAALRHLPPKRLVLAPDCGMKYLPRPMAFGKLQALAKGAAIVRREMEIWEDAAP